MPMFVYNTFSSRGFQFKKNVEESGCGLVSGLYIPASFLGRCLKKDPEIWYLLGLWVPSWSGLIGLTGRVGFRLC